MWWSSRAAGHILLVITLVVVLVCGIPSDSENSCANYSGGHFGHQNLSSMLTLFVRDVSPVLQILNLPTQSLTSLGTGASTSKHVRDENLDLSTQLHRM